MSRFRELLRDDRPHLFDGAMGTELYARGVFINQCYDELNLRNPELVATIHRAYVTAGAELIETNTYGANRLKLSSFGLEDEVAAVNRAGVEIARDVAGKDVLVAGAVGPLDVRIEPFGPTGLEEARGYFREQAAALAEGGADVVVLETFGDVNEIEEAIRGVREACDLPLVAQVTLTRELATPYGTEPEDFGPRLEEAGADAVGMNCSVGPHAMLEAVERLRPVTDLPLSVQPNAGLPREVGGRKMYMASPEYMANYARRLVESGVTLVGGCCGTGPDHIRKMAEVVAEAAPGADRPRIRMPGDGEDRAEVTPLARRSGLGRKLASGEMVTSVELLPPKGVRTAALVEAARAAAAAGADVVALPDGARAQMRMGALAAAALVQEEAGIEAVAHYTCRDRNLLGMLSDLLGADALGIRNLLMVTGDPPKTGPYGDATAVFDVDSIGLTNLVHHLNHGLDPGGNPVGGATSFVMGVAANPGALDIEYELDRFHWKVEAGAEFAVTQPIFDPGALRSFLDALEERGMRIPVVAGIWPVGDADTAEYLANEVPGITVPAGVIDRMRRAGEAGEAAAGAEGIAVAREVVEAVRERVAGFHVHAPDGRVGPALEVLDGVIEGPAPASDGGDGG